MITQNAEGNKIGEIREIQGRLKIVRVGAFTDKNGEYFSQLRWYALSGKEIRRYKKLLPPACGCQAGIFYEEAKK